MRQQYMDSENRPRQKDDRPLNMPRESEDRFPRVAQRLSDLRQTLPDCAMRAYQALQLALQPHSRPHGSRPHFERDFHESLSILFPDAWDISARQIGSWNQWEVQVDDGPPMYCSVRLEILGDDNRFLKEIKSKARIVKDTLLEDNGRWKRNLQPENGAFNWERLSQFEKECALRAQQSSTSSVATVQSKRNGNAWMEPKVLCEMCGKSKDDDQLSGVHMCVVCATFQCPECRYSWTSYHGRLRPDHETLMGQQCSRCNGQGVAKDWRVVPNEGPNPQDSGNRPQYGMHQNELCDACREFGNCMGVFYDPFVLTTALSLVSGSYVQWKSFSEEMPELLIADLGPQFKDLQVCLQPHVYVAQPQNETHVEELTTYQRATRSSEKGKTRNSGRGNFLDLRGMDNGSIDRRRAHANATRHRRGNGLMDEAYAEGEEQLPRGKKASGGVKDTTLFQRFLKDDAPQTKEIPQTPQTSRDSQVQPGYNLFEHCHAEVGIGASSSLLHSGRQPSNAFSTITEQSAPVRSGRDLLPYDEASDSSQASWLKMMKPISLPHPPAAEKVPKANKFNKINSLENALVKQLAPQPPSPLLDALPPLRRAQFLQIVVRQVKAGGGVEADKFNLAEEYLSRCNGDYEKAYQYVKALSEGTISAP